MSFKYIKIEFETDHIAWLKLNRPESKNAFNELMINELCQALWQLETNKDLRVILLTGEGSAFCAGGDIKSMQNKSGMFEGNPAQLRMKYRYGIQTIPRVMQELSVPVIAVVNGPAVGAGCDLACMCDLRIGGKESYFSESFAGLNLVPGDGGSYFLQRVVGFSKAMQMSLTCEVKKAREAYDFGLLNYYTEDSLNDFVKEIASKIATQAPEAIRMIKRSLIHAYQNDLASSLELLASFQGIAQNMHDHDRGIQALMNQQKVNFERN
jgi:enoyl-CoA hydratase/carnithine racemase